MSGHGCRRMVMSVLVAVIVAGLIGCDRVRSDGPRAGGVVRVLFIGNSLTYWNDLPMMVATFAELDSQSVFVRSVALPDYSLADHLAGTKALSALHSEPWDVVVMQQGPSSLPESRTELIRSALAFQRPIADAGARPALYMVWPSRDRLPFMEDVRRSYQLAADTIDGAFIPAGIAWMEAWKRDPSLQLYSADQLHPSLEGSALAALTIYGVVFSRDVRTLPDSIEAPSLNGLTSQRMILLQEAAFAASRQGFAPGP